MNLGTNPERSIGNQAYECLIKRPNPFGYLTEKGFSRAQRRWEKRLTDLKERIVGGESTGSALSDFALVGSFTYLGARRAEKYLQQLGERIEASAGKEILIVSRRGEYHKLAILGKGPIEKQVSEQHPVHAGMSLVIACEGYASYNPMATFRYQVDPTTFHPENLAIPRDVGIPGDLRTVEEVDRVFIGNGEIIPWVELSKDNEIAYARLSRTLQTGLFIKQGLKLNLEELNIH